VLYEAREQPAEPLTTPSGITPLGQTTTVSLSTLEDVFGYNYSFRWFAIPDLRFHHFFLRSQRVFALKGLNFNKRWLHSWFVDHRVRTTLARLLAR
jgi:hypothetical protein